MSHVDAEPRLPVPYELPLQLPQPSNSDLLKQLVVAAPGLLALLGVGYVGYTGGKSFAELEGKVEELTGQLVQMEEQISNTITDKLSRALKSLEALQARVVELEKHTKESELLVATMRQKVRYHEGVLAHLGYSPSDHAHYPRSARYSSQGSGYDPQGDYSQPPRFPQGSDYSRSADYSYSRSYSQPPGHSQPLDHSQPPRAHGNNRVHQVATRGNPSTPEERETAKMNDLIGQLSSPGPQ